jgi:nitroimidazol reductase NimA-like FMN-containing flavoprotein (pyridoxamine 5'-phosphate oxidase superfamily)
MANRETPLTPQERAEAEKAYAEVKAALALVSSKLNKGRTEAAKNLNHLESLDKVFKKKKSRFYRFKFICVCIYF